MDRGTTTADRQVDDHPAIRLIGGAYPPPLPRAGARPRGARPTQRPGPSPTRHRAAPGRSRLAGALTVVSVLLAVAALASALLPQRPAPARLEVPVAVAAAPTPAPSTAPATVALAPVVAEPVVAAPVVGVPVRVQLPALGVVSEIVPVGLADDGTLQVPTDDVGWYQLGPAPGQVGPAVLAGHVDWAGHRGAFAGLAALEPGDQVVVDGADGGQRVFLVDRVVQVNKAEFPTAQVYGDLDAAGLRLVTCGGDFDADTGEYADDIVVFASFAG